MLAPARRRTMAMKLLTLLHLLLGCDRTPEPVTPQAPPVASAEPVAPARRPPPLFGIGGGERDPQTHISFETPKQLVAASVHVAIDRAAPAGLNFFALQVDFNNGTWAHGGVQDVDGPEGRRIRQINWGGLVDRGGGTADYENENDVADLDKIQNPPPGQHVGPYAWKDGVEYEYRIDRGAQVTLPPGTYRLIPDRPLVRVTQPRVMWEWRFTVRPVSEPGPSFVAVLYDGAESFNSMYVWNESGYGSTSAAQHTSWWTPLYVALGDTVAKAPSSWDRF